MIKCAICKKSTKSIIKHFEKYHPKELKKYYEDEEKFKGVI